ncbi:MAG TPA: NAD(P)-dependent oxidoreductase [Solirubrobacter sp.]|nr:NAD(P)-dependent oxidoreductase [Solirubrobacter sp.]
MPSVLVTPRSFGAHDPALWDELHAAFDRVLAVPGDARDEVAAALAEADAYIAGVEAIDRALLAGAPHLRIVARYGVGVDNVDLGAARELGVLVTNTPGANSAAVAELTLGLLLALARRVPDSLTRVAAGEWPRVVGLGLAGKTLALVGLGAIGRLVADRALAFGCRVVAADPYAPEHPGVERRDLADVLTGADFVSLHAPLTAETRGLVDAVFLARLAPGALLVNTARAELIDEAALLAALETGRLAGVALDALATEPPPPGHPLLGRPDVLVTPHMGAHTDQAADAMGRGAVDACLAVLAGRRPDHLVHAPKEPV